MKTDLVILLTQRLWQALSGVLTIVLVAHFLTPELQGWYYSFISIAALYTLFDLGLSLVIIQITAHLFVGLNWGHKGRPEGNRPHQFQSFIIQIFRHYLVLALVFALLAIPGGLLFFTCQTNSHPVDFNWMAAWISMALITAIAIITIPALALVEGSGNIREVYLIRLIQGIAGSIGCWIVLIAHGGLWATIMTPLMSIATISLWLWIKRPHMLSAPTEREFSALKWKTEVWPLQWKIGLSWLSGYLLTAIYTPILFHYQGAVVAGQMGLSLTIANMLGFLAQSWIARHVPAMAQAAAIRDWTALDRLFRRDLIISTSAYLAGAAALCGAYRIAQGIPIFTPYLGRILPFWSFFGLLCIALLNHLVAAFAAQLRSYKQEPLVWLAVVAAAITVPCAIWASAVYSAAGVVSTILCVQLFISLPVATWIRQKTNTTWRAR